MKNRIKIIALVLMACLTITSCEEDKLTALNIDKNSSTDIDMKFLLPLGQLRVAGSRYESWRTNLIYSSTLIQHNAALAGYWSGDKYYYNAQYSGAFWERHYPDAIKLLTHVYDQTEGDAKMINYHAAAGIMRAFDLHKMTDLYGDIPYTQAGRGLDGDVNWFPAYESQKDVYALLVADIKKSRDEFSASAPAMGAQDVLFGGDVTKWKRFANSLLMRIAMRMSNVDATTARAVFTEAAASGPINSNATNAFLVQSLGAGGDINQNGTSLALSNAAGGGGDAGNARVSKFFLDWMNKNNDPRKMIIVGGLGNPFDATTWVTDPSKQRGLPNGYTSSTIKTIDPNFASLNEYSFINGNIRDLEDPTPFISYAETELMLAEAALKGWVTTSAETHFNNGVKAAMASWEWFGVAVPSAASVDAYIAAQKFGAASNADKLKLIGEQYWAATYLNHVESWSNWRRTGYPTLTPTSDPNNETGGTIPRRLRYFEGEIGSNPKSYAAAIARQGADVLTTKVWWDGGK